MNLEGKIYGYEKKILATIALVVFVAGAMFYAGAKYEKRKLSNLGLLKTSADKTKKKPAEKKPANEIVTPKEGSEIPSNQSTNTTVSPTTSVKATPAPTTTPANLQK
jgi:hypothetical protein